MVNSNIRKLCLSGWLKTNHEKEYDTPLKLQKFLFFYEAFTKADGEKPDFSSLKGYKKGPVFSDVWGDYTKERAEFDTMAEKMCHKIQINTERAEQCAFLVAILSESELSDLTHGMHIWARKKERIFNNERQVELCEDDFTDEDSQLMHTLEQMYPIDMIRSSAIYSINNTQFVFQKQDLKRITENHCDALMFLTETEELHNPVYVDIDEEGRLIID